jgi:orotidine 5'-phosphate decarboxylase subfamily 1
MAQKLLKLMEDKKSNLCVAADLTSQSQLLELADALGPSIVIFKTHVDILADFHPDFGQKLRRLAEKHRFLIFEDRKFADIGQTVSLQYRGGLYKIADWADIVNAHPIAGPGVIEALKSSSLILLAQMSSAGTLATGTYTKKVVQIAEQNLDTVMGFICVKKLSDQPGLIHCTPGVKLHPGHDHLGQQYRTIEEILIKNRSDLIIVGRDITHATNPEKQAALYREKGWEAYAQTIS